MFGEIPAGRKSAPAGGERPRAVPASRGASAKGSPLAALSREPAGGARWRAAPSAGHSAFGALAVSFSRIRADLPERSRR